MWLQRTPPLVNTLTEDTWIQSNRALQQPVGLNSASFTININVSYLNAALLTALFPFASVSIQQPTQ
jgi:hypothetical protein